jgi:hypothetical protein
MAVTGRTTAVGVFSTHDEARAAVDDLRRAGFPEDQIGVAARDHESRGTFAAEGAATGAVAGAGVGALWAIGIAAGMLPAIGPVVAGGLLGSILASAAGGAAVAGIVGALIGMGIPEEEAKYYEGEFAAGRPVVTVRAGDRFDAACTILRRHGSYDWSTRRTTPGVGAPVGGP